MIKKLLQRVFGAGKTSTKNQKAATATRQPSKKSSAAKRIPSKVHRIDRKLLSTGAIKTTEGLQKAGFQAFVVGGAVRDLLLKKRPKDFDIATDATPEEVNRIFRRSRIIGRRFRLVHVMFGSETVEVSTFRGSHLDESDEALARIAESGRILRDNVFGNQEQDAARRDFTANALYYDPATEDVLDFHNGVADIQAGVLRMIGDPAMRYR